MSRKLYDENMTDSKMEEYLEESSIVQDDKRLKQENEYMRQELHVLRLKLAASTDLTKELEQINEALEKSLAEEITKREKKEHAKEEERYKAERTEYEDYIGDLEILNKESANQIAKLYKEIKEYKDILSERQQRSPAAECSLMIYKKEVEALAALLKSGGKKMEYLEKQLAHMELKYHEMEDIAKITKEQLVEKNNALEDTREDLVACRMEVESLRTFPASDTCKGNSLFAEVEDRRQMLLDRMKRLQDKYNEMREELKVKRSEIKQLRTENAVMVRKFETDAVDAAQNNADLLNKYKSRISVLENKLKAEVKKNNAAMENMLPTDDSGMIE